MGFSAHYYNEYFSFLHISSLIVLTRRIAVMYYGLVSRRVWCYFNFVEVRIRIIGKRKTLNFLCSHLNDSAVVPHERGVYLGRLFCVLLNAATSLSYGFLRGLRIWRVWEFAHRGRILFSAFEDSLAEPYNGEVFCDILPDVGLIVSIVLELPRYKRVDQLINRCFERLVSCLDWFRSVEVQSSLLIDLAFFGC